MTFGDRLHAAVAARGPLCAGIDPHAGLLEAWGLTDDVAGLEAFALGATEAIAPHVAVVKPQSAFFERFGSRGVAVLERVIATAREAGAQVLLDVKRGDIGSTSQAYADAYLDPASPLAADAITASPYLGFGSLTPMIETARRHGAGVFVLALTSNPEGPEVQHATGPSGRTVAGTVLDHLRALNAGATRSAPTARSSARRCGRPGSRSTSAAPSSPRATARRAAPSTTCGRSSARPSAGCCRAPRVTCSDSAPTPRRCARVRSASRTRSPDWSGDPRRRRRRADGRPAAPDGVLERPGAVLRRRPGAPDGAHRHHLAGRPRRAPRGAAGLPRPARPGAVRHPRRVGPGRRPASRPCSPRSTTPASPPRTTTRRTPASRRTIATRSGPPPTASPRPRPRGPSTPSTSRPATSATRRWCSDESACVIRLPVRTRPHDVPQRPDADQATARVACARGYDWCTRPSGHRPIAR